MADIGPTLGDLIEGRQVGCVRGPGASAAPDGTTEMLHRELTWLVDR